MSTFSPNVTLKFNRAITGATTVNANCYAEVTYIYSSQTLTLGTSRGNFPILFQRSFGAGQAIPASISIASMGTANGDQATVVYTLASGYELINTP